MSTEQIDLVGLALQDAGRRLAADRATYDRMVAEFDAQHSIDTHARTLFVTHCRRATATDYAEWLAGWLRTGGWISHPYDYPMPSWLVLQTRPDDIPSLYGALSMQVIVPADVDLQPADIPDTFHGGCGHSTFYFMDGFTIVGDFVPLYTDVHHLLAEIPSDQK